MRQVKSIRLFTVFTIIALSAPTLRADGNATQKAKTIRDILWVWGNPEMAKGNDADHTLASYVQATPARRAQLLGTPNIVMAGRGIPNDRTLAKAETESVKYAPRIVWEILPDGDVEYSDKFDYTQRVAQIAELKAAHPNLEAVMLDDMTSVAVDRGFEPEHMQMLKKLLKSGKQPVDLWGVFYTMNFGRPNIDDYIQPLDVINLWTWHAKDLVDLEKNVAYCEKRFPGKPIFLGLYLRDYGDSREIPPNLLQLQCETALKLAHAGRIAGIVFLTVDNDAAALEWTADWIKRVGDQKLGLQQASDDSQLLRNNLWAWGNPEMATDGPHTTASFAQAGPADRARLLGVENIFLAGSGVPLEYDQAEAINAKAAGAERLIWEMLPDDADQGEYATRSVFDYSGRLDVVCKLATKFPQIEAVLLDDMTTVAVSKGLKPDHLRRIRETLAAKGRADLKLWGVVYTMNLEETHLPEFVKELDVILLCEWHGEKLVDLDSSVRRVRKMFPDKPIVLGTYLHDYGGNRPMPRELLEHQFKVALELAKEGIIGGVEFTTINNDESAVELTAEWIRRAGSERIGK